MTSTSIPMSTCLDVATQEKLKAIAVRQKHTPHALATEAIEQMITEKEREYAWHESCDAALRHFDETGLHATHNEVMTWMESWGTDKDIANPAISLHRSRSL